MDDILKQYAALLDKYKEFDRKKIPLCAAENYLSSFSKSALAGIFEGKYSIGNHNEYIIDDDFIGGEYIHELCLLLEKECRRVFECKYGDARTLTGMNCFAIVAQSLLQSGNNVLLTTPNQGGHPSVPFILKVLGINYEEIPYDYEKYELDYKRLNNLLDKNKYDALIFCQSDLIQPIDISKIALKNELVLFDGTQTLGMIAAKIHQNPLKMYDNIVLFGGAHKTLPGPSTGIVLCDNDKLIERLDSNISPIFLRNFQPNTICALLLSLIEFEKIGYKYMNKTIENCNLLGSELEKCGFRIAKFSKKYSLTHQIFILASEEETEQIFQRARDWGITLNKKNKELFKGYGIRLGLQEVSRYNWGLPEMRNIATLLKALKENDNIIIEKIVEILCRKKQDAYAIDDLIIE